jgi:hypothetical protein
LKPLKLLKIEDYNYSIVYINNNDTYQVYRRLGENSWQEFSGSNWKEILNSSELEKLFKKSKNNED